MGEDALYVYTFLSVCPIASYHIDDFVCYAHENDDCPAVVSAVVSDAVFIVRGGAAGQQTPSS